MIGRVTKSTGMWYEVEAEDKKYLARLRGKFRLEEKKITNPIAVGDKVVMVPHQQDKKEYVITEILERKNYVIRQSPRKKGHDHMLASNIDQGVVIVTLKMPRTSEGFVDRFLITLETFRIPAYILFNKKDLYGKKEREKFEFLQSIYENSGYKVHLCSFHTDVEEIRSIFYGKVSLLVGHSGSGKSTLLNGLVSSAGQETSAVSSFANKGVHTTTYAELFKMGQNSAVIDTPGIKELGLSDILPEELSHYFPEMRDHLGQCKYYNCLHLNEPGCKIKELIGTGISELRYKSYLSMLESSENRR